MADSQVDVTLAPAKILSVTELKNGQVWVATEGKIYQFVDGKLRPLIFADVEHETVMAGSQPKPIGAVPAAPAPVAPPKPVDAAPPPPPTTPMGGPPPASPKSV